MLTLYKASAGSGKTYTLALTYITLLLGYRTEEGEWRLRKRTDGAVHKSILAVTFTNKATAEMKKRIIEELALLSDPNTASGSSYAKSLKELFKADIDSISDAAREALIGLLLNFNDFNVSTIDSFFQNVLRTFARELELPDNFELRLDEKDIISEAVRDILDTVNGNSMLLSNDNPKEKNGEGNLFNWLRRFMEMHLEQGKKFNLFNREGKLFGDLVSHLMALMDEQFKLKYSDIEPWLSDVAKIVELESFLISRIKTLKQEICDGAYQILEREEELRTSYNDKILSRYIIPTLSNWAKGDIDFSKDLPSTIIGIASGDKKKAVYAGYYKMAGDDDPFLNDVFAYCSAIVKNMENLVLYRFILAHLYPVGLLGELLVRLEKFRQQKTALMLSDTTDFLSKIIDEDDAPFIYERIGTRLRHFLLDEFQDTSMMQWNNLKPLLIESLSTGNDNLIIGDEKQCIYRFRNSDPSLINNVVEKQLVSRDIDVMKKGDKVVDNTNWRSAPEIIRFNNSLFVALRKYLDIEDIYGGVVQLIPSKSQDVKGYVDIKIVDTDSLTDTDETVEDIGLKRMADAIKRQLDSGYRPSQIAVLVRTGGEGSRVIRYLLDYFNSEEWGERSKPQVISADSLTLNESRIVKMIISKFRLAVENGQHNENSNPVYKSKEELNALLNRFFINNLTSSDASTALEDAIENFQQACGKTDVTSQEPSGVEYFGNKKEYSGDLLSLIRRIMADVIPSMGKNGTSLLNSEGVFFATFLDQVIEFVNREGNDIAGFLRWWETTGNAINVSVPDSIDAISVMTIHKSKGLEFPCVHIPILKFDLIRRSSALQKNYHWFDLKGLDLYDEGLVPRYLPFEVSEKVGKISGLRAEYEELKQKEKVDNVNLVYVALTRASRELIVTATDKRDKQGETIKIGGIILDSIRNWSPDCTPDFDQCFIKLEDFIVEDSHLTIGMPTCPDDNGGEKRKSEIMPAPTSFSDNRITEVTTPEIYESIDCNDKIQWGWFLHKILSRVRVSGDLQKSIEKTAIEHNVEGRFKEKAGAVLEKALKQPDAYNWFHGFKRVLNETEITFTIEQEDTVKKKRPDRIVWTSDGHVDVIDYKFGEANPKYKKQVRTYMRLLVQMGVKNVRGFIWYPLTSDIEKVDL